MLIKVSETLQYEVESAKLVNSQIEAVLLDGRTVSIGGDLSAVEVIGGEIKKDTTPSVEEILNAMLGVE